MPTNDYLLKIRRRKMKAGDGLGRVPPAAEGLRREPVAPQPPHRPVGVFQFRNVAVGVEQRRRPHVLPERLAVTAQTRCIGGQDNGDVMEFALSSGLQHPAVNRRGFLELACLMRL